MSLMILGLAGQAKAAAKQTVAERALSTGPTGAPSSPFPASLFGSAMPAPTNIVAPVGMPDAYGVPTPGGMNPMMLAAAAVVLFLLLR